MSRGMLLELDLDSLEKVNGGGDGCQAAGEAWIAATVAQAGAVANRVRKGPRDESLIKAEKEANGQRTAAWRAYEECLNGGKAPESR